jgi:hypothetical protein
MTSFKVKNINNFYKQDPLLKYSWPPVAIYTRNEEFLNFIELLPNEQKSYLELLRKNTEDHGRFIHRSLSIIYAYCFGYKDSALYLKTDDDLESKIILAKFQLEREMLDQWLIPPEPPKGLNQEEACAYVTELIKINSGIYHPFFNYLETKISANKMIEFLQFETVRNEVVDDEVALIIVGLQGQMKNVMSSNLWDECGNGEITSFHTYWLRRLINSLDIADSFCNFRDEKLPWFTSITSNSFNMMATRSGYKYRAYGSFLITESWVKPHFDKILNGLKRLDLLNEDINIYFKKHCVIDPCHTEQIKQAFTYQQPRLDPEEVNEVLWGAHTAVIAGTKLYDLSIKYFTEE